MPQAGAPGEGKAAHVPAGLTEPRHRDLCGGERAGEGGAIMDAPVADAAFLAAVREAEAAMRSLFDPTPLQRNDYLSGRYGCQVWLKREDLTPVRSYKIRGAFNAMRKALAARPDRRRFVCASAGNHAQGMAFACRHFGTGGVVFMPVTTPQQKIDKTRQFGGGQVEIRLTGDYFDDALRSAQHYARQADAFFMPPFDDADVIEGQATVATEILDQLPDGLVADLVVIPVGGGGLSAGMMRVLRARIAGDGDPSRRTRRGRRASSGRWRRGSW